MVPGQFEIRESSNAVKDLAEKIFGVGIETITRICEQYGSEEDECRKFDVYRIKTHLGTGILKKSSEREALNYEKYLSKMNFNVPRFLGKYDDGKNLWIAIENIDGEDLRNMTDRLAKEAADSIAAIQNAYWNDPDTERFDTYIERIKRRYSFIQSDDVIGRAYRLFLDRQTVCPRTMSNGDFLQFNAINSGGKVYIIDWGFGGIMPYSLDIARFIAHGTEDRATFPFFMNDIQKSIFVDSVYKALKEKPDYEQYLYDIRLAVLNEYVEFIEADEDEDNWYLEHSYDLANQVISGQS